MMPLVSDHGPCVELGNEIGFLHIEHIYIWQFPRLNPMFNTVNSCI